MSGDQKKSFYYMVSCFHFIELYFGAISDMVLSLAFRLDCNEHKNLFFLYILKMARSVFITFIMVSFSAGENLITR